MKRNPILIYSLFMILVISQTGLDLSPNNVLSKISEPKKASDGQWLDHVITFSPDSTTYEFNYIFEKNYRYDFRLQVYTPNTEIHMMCVLRGPDGDGDGSDDIFNLAEGRLKDNATEVGDFTFGATITGNYTLTITGESERNINVHFLTSEAGRCHQGPATVYDVAGYYDNKLREYIFELEDDIEYLISVERASSFDTGGPSGDYGYVDVTLVYLGVTNPVNDTFYLIEYAPLAKVFVPIQVSFGTADKGQYRLEITVYTSVGTLNLHALLTQANTIGDGPEDNPIPHVQNETDTDSNSTSNFSIHVPEWVLPVTLCIVVGLVSSFVFIVVRKKSDRDFNNE